MKRILLFAVVSIILAATSVMAQTSLMSMTMDLVGATGYLYILENGPDSDIVSCLHIFAPVDPLLITADETDGWLFEAKPFAENGGADLVWTAIADGLGNNDSVMFSISTPASVEINDSYVLPGYTGNWGYEAEDFPGIVPIMMDSVEVPQLMMSPEPCSLMAMGLGCLGLLAGRRRLIK